MHAEAIRIRVATTADHPAMIPVINDAFAIETFLEGTRTDNARLTGMMSTGTFLVAEDEAGRIIASVYVEIRGTRGYIGMLAVNPALQGKGLGRAMVEAAEDYCRRMSCVAMDLTVLSLRPDLPPRYRKLGYVESGTEEFLPSRSLKDGMRWHCIVMSKTL